MIKQDIIDKCIIADFVKVRFMSKVDFIKSAAVTIDGGIIRVTGQNAFLIAEEGEFLCTESGKLFNILNYQS